MIAEEIRMENVNHNMETAMEHNPEAFAEVSIEDFMGLSIKDVRSNLAIFNFFLSHPTKLENKCLGSRHKMRN